MVMMMAMRQWGGRHDDRGDNRGIRRMELEVCGGVRWRWCGVAVVMRMMYSEDDGCGMAGVWSGQKSRPEIGWHRIYYGEEKMEMRVLYIKCETLLSYIYSKKS
ncbi:hypothetical protein Tco_1149360 [Tanacetum coccineum]